jgi:hypothetical protein
MNTGIPNFSMHIPKDSEEPLETILPLLGRRQKHPEDLFFPVLFCSSPVVYIKR